MVQCLPSFQSPKLQPQYCKSHCPLPEPGAECPGEEVGHDSLPSQDVADVFLLPQFMMDASNPTQLSASCVQLLGLLSAQQLSYASVLILFNKMYGSAG